MEPISTPKKCRGFFTGCRAAQATYDELQVETMMKLIEELRNEVTRLQNGAAAWRPQRGRFPDALYGIVADRARIWLRAMRHWVVAVLSLLMAVSSPIVAWAFNDQTQNVAAVEASQPLPLEGTLTNPVWQAGAVAKDFVNFTTRRPAAPEVATTVYILYDATYLYVGFVCNQASAPITANQITNGVGEELDDQVEIDIDTSGNGTRVYTFKTTRRAARYQASSEFNRFDPPWRAAASIHQASWSAEMIIPLKDLRAEAGTHSSRINFQRRIAALNESFSWAYSPQMSSPDQSQYWPALTGIRIAGSSTAPFRTRISTVWQV